MDNDVINGLTLFNHTVMSYPFRMGKQYFISNFFKFWKFLYIFLDDSAWYQKLLYCLKRPVLYNYMQVTSDIVKWIHGKKNICFQCEMINNLNYLIRIFMLMKTISSWKQNSLTTKFILKLEKAKYFKWTSRQWYTIIINPLETSVWCDNSLHHQVATINEETFPQYFLAILKRMLQNC